MLSSTFRRSILKSPTRLTIVGREQRTKVRGEIKPQDALFDDSSSVVLNCQTDSLLVFQIHSFSKASQCSSCCNLLVLIFEQMN